MKRWHKKQIRCALQTAIDYNESLLDAHRIVWRKVESAYEHRKCFPYDDKEIMANVRRWQREIENWKKLLQGEILK